MSTLLLITIVMLVAATMAGVFTMNMNITQRVSNGSIALAEAEAGIAEVMYQISQEANVTDRNGENPKIEWGLNNETIKRTITKEMSPEEAFHVVTFDPGSEFPHSTNNTTLTNDTGSLGRTVPDGMLHIVSTGYCKGQYRTVECVIEKPPFPFGLAASGKIHSRDPLRVVGVSSIAQLQAGQNDRPGHVLCNSVAGITIEQVSPPRSTEISGFVKSSGPVDIAQPAIVRGGVRTNTDKTELTDIDIESFRNQGLPGVVTLLEDTYSVPQEMDIMYYYSGPQLTYNGSVNLKQAMLYCDGDLVLNGPLTGEGIIVVNGNAFFNAGTNLAGSNKLAVLASGNVSIHGSNNFFTGLVYTEGNLDARHITIVGNTIVNSAESSKGIVELENVTFVSNEETADMTITVTSSSNASSQVAGGRFPFPLLLNNGVFGMPDGITEGGNLDGWPGDLSVSEIKGMLTGSNPLTSDGPQANSEGNLWNVAVFGDNPIIFGNGPLPPDSEGLKAGLVGLIATANQAQADLATIEALKAEREGLEPGSARIGEINGQIEQLESEIETAFGVFNDAAGAFAQQAYDYVQSHTDENGTYNSDDVTVDMDIIQEHRFNLNEYLPESERIKVAFWKVYPKRM